MNNQFNSRSFRLAPMSPLIQALTLLFLVAPSALLIGALIGKHSLLPPAVWLFAIDAWVWLRFRPSAFLINAKTLEVIWPLKRRDISRDGITSARVVNRQELKREIGWGMRVGAGPIWGGFGWLWTTRRGVVQMYISRTDDFVWIERADGRPWLLTTEEPENFVGALSQR